MSNRKKLIAILIGIGIGIGILLIGWGLGPDKPVEGPTPSIDDPLYKAATYQECWFVAFPDRQVAFCDEGTYVTNPIQTK